MSYNPNNEAKGKVGETLVNHSFTSNGFTVKFHNVTDWGCDGIFYGNGIELGCYEVNYWQPNTYFSDEKINGINTNLYNGLEWLNGNYVNHRDEVQYRFHITIGANRSEAQIADATELGIIYIHFETLPTEAQLWKVIASHLGLNPYNKFYKVSCVKDVHSENDRTSMVVLLTPILYNLINNIQVRASLISSKINNIFDKKRLKRSLLKLNSPVKAKLSKCSRIDNLVNKITSKHYFGK
jgi:hypothetical protein